MSHSRYENAKSWSDPEPSAPSQDGQKHDPLAELARLIDEDPFADFERRREQAPQPQREPQPQRLQEESWRSAPGHAAGEPDWNAERPANDENPRAAQPESSRIVRYDPPAAPAPRRDFDPVAHLEAELASVWEQPQTVEPDAPQPVPQAEAEGQDWRYDADPEPDYGYRAEPDGYSEQDYDAGQAYEQPEPQNWDGQGRAGDDTYNYGYDYGYEENAPRRPRKGLLVVTALGAVLVVGGAGAVAYRSLVGEPSGPPPVIRADTSPVKIQPTEDQSASSEETPGKLVYDRVGGQPAEREERIVSREEPVFAVEGRDRDVRVIETGGEGMGLRQTSEGDEPLSDQPRRVRTVVVRPDGTIVAPSDPVGQQGQAAATVPPAAPAVETSQSPAIPGAQENAAAAPPAAEDTAPTPVETASVQPEQVPSQPQPQPQQPSAAPSSGAPMQLVPDSGAASAPQQPAQPQQQAAAPNPDTSSAPQVGAFPAGSYVVQVASTRTEDEARATASAVSDRYAGVISSYQPGIERADLGDRGIFYRVGVGPVQSQSDANLLCEQLKSEGLDCFVRRN